MQPFQFHLPVNIYFGRSEFEKAGLLTAQHGKKALIVTGRGSTKKSGLLDRLCGLLKTQGLEYAIFDRVPSNPLTTTVYEGVDFLKESGCDVVFGLGGGSVMDAAKGIAFSALNEGDMSDYIFGLKPHGSALPIILAATTAGTGSEGNNFAVLTNPETKDKKSLKAMCIFAKASIVDPELMTTMPKEVAASTSFDALAHNVEAFLARRGTPFSSMMALEGIRLLVGNMHKVYDDPTDVEAFEKVALASTIGGMVICQAGVGAPHALEHPASGLYDVTHGKGLAALVPGVIDYTVARYSDRKYFELAGVLGINDIKEIGGAIRRLTARIGLTENLKQLGVKEDDLEWLAENSVKIMSANLENNPLPIDQSAALQIYKGCLNS